MDFLRTILNLHRYPDQVTRRQALLAYGTTAFIVVAYSLYAFFVVDWSYSGDPTINEYTMIQFAQLLPRVWFYLALFYGFALFSFISIRAGYINTGAWGPPLMWLSVGIIPPLVEAGNFTSPLNIASLMIFIVIASLFKRIPGVFLSTTIASLALVLDFPEAFAPNLPGLLLVVVGMGVLCYFFVTTLELSREEGQTTATAERLKLAELNTRITREAAQNKDLNAIVSLALEAILANYPLIYHAQLFLIDDEGVQARLVASTGESGQRLLDRKHSLPVGSLSVIGQTTLKGVPTVAQAGVRDTIHRPNPDLPDTLVEAAFPLRIGPAIIGALDLQSREQSTLTSDDVATFQSIADSLALVIDNVRQFDSVQAQIYENQQLTEQTQRALEEVERLNKRLIGRAWSEYLAQHSHDIGVNVDFTNNTSQSAADWTPGLTEAFAQNGIVQADGMLSVPLRVRGQVIGAMEFELDDNGQIAPEDLELIEEIGERFGLAAENTRLVEESQRVAQREALINEISSRFQATNDVESTLAEAARSLRETLKAERIVIRLGTHASAVAKPSSTT